MHEVHRNAIRVLLVEPEGRSLLVRGRDPRDLDRGEFYWTVGGGIDADESVAACAHREVLEEVGHDLGSGAPHLDRVVAVRQSSFPFDGRLVHQRERYVYAPVAERFDPAPTGLSALESRAIVGFSWLSTDEMRTSDAPVYPLGLPDVLDRLATEPPPSTPWQLH